MSDATNSSGEAEGRPTRVREVLALVVALLVAVGATATIAHATRPQRGAGEQQAAAMEALTATPTVPSSTSPHPSATATPSPAPSPSPTVRQVTRRVPTPTSSPTSPPTAKPTRTPKPKGTPTAAPLYLAQKDELAAWSGERWQYADGVLINDGTSVDAHPWLQSPYEVTAGGFAVEAKIRVVGRAAGKCEQSFGVVAEGAEGEAWGGGVIFGCDGVARARLTDVRDWANGYNRDRVLAAEDFDPGDGWHRYRLEVDGTQLRLAIDGKTVLEATVEGGADGSGPGHSGLWSQGVAVAVRRVTVFAM